MQQMPTWTGWDTHTHSESINKPLQDKEKVISLFSSWPYIQIILFTPAWQTVLQPSVLSSTVMNEGMWEACVWLMLGISVLVSRLITESRLCNLTVLSWMETVTSDPMFVSIDLRLAQKAVHFPSHSPPSPRKLTDAGRRIPMICDIKWSWYLCNSNRRLYLAGVALVTNTCKLAVQKNVVMSSVEFKPLLYSSVFGKPRILMSDGIYRLSQFKNQTISSVQRSKNTPVCNQKCSIHVFPLKK